MGEEGQTKHAHGESCDLTEAEREDTSEVWSSQDAGIWITFRSRGFHWSEWCER